MSTAFDLKPNLEHLKRYGYTLINPIEVDAVDNADKRIAIENSFRTLLNKYNLTEHYDTLLYICLIESNQAELQLNHIHQIYESHSRVKQLAQFLLIFKPSNRHKPNTLKLTSMVDTVKVTDLYLLNG